LPVTLKHQSARIDHFFGSANDVAPAMLVTSHQEIGHAGEVVCCRQTDEKVPVLVGAVSLVEQADPEQVLAGKHQLDYQDAKTRPVFLNPVADQRIMQYVALLREGMGVDDAAIIIGIDLGEAITDLGPGVLGKGRDLPFHLRWQPLVIAVEEADVVAGRRPDASVTGCGDAPIALMPEVSYPFVPRPLDDALYVLT